MSTCVLLSTPYALLEALGSTVKYCQVLRDYCGCCPYGVLCDTTLHAIDTTLICSFVLSDCSAVRREPLEIAHAL